jgi:inorganic pyrophosphatase
MKGVLKMFDEKEWTLIIQAVRHELKTYDKEIQEEKDAFIKRGLEEEKESFLALYRKILNEELS